MSFFAPNTQNYTLGKGVPYFAKLLSPGVYDAERDLGNAPTFTVSVALETLEHFSSRSGVRTKDLEVNAQISPALGFSLDEVNAANLCLTTLGSESQVVQAAGAASGTFTITSDPALGPREYTTAEKQIGVQSVTYTNEAGGPFVAAETITGGTSAATAVVLVVTPTQLLINTIAGGPFQAAEQITGGTSTATADLTTPSALDQADLALINTTQANAPLVKGTDYIVNGKAGRIRILDSSTAVVDDVISYTGEALAATFTRIAMYAERQIEGRFRFVSDSDVGTNFEAYFHRVKLSPDGDTAFIGDDWTTLSFTGEILDSSTDHPADPFGYMLIEQQ